MKIIILIISLIQLLIIAVSGASTTANEIKLNPHAIDNNFNKQQQQQQQQMDLLRQKFNVKQEKRKKRQIINDENTTMDNMDKNNDNNTTISPRKNIFQAIVSAIESVIGFFYGDRKINGTNNAGFKKQ